MYWTLDTRPPTVDEILHQGAERIRAAIEAVCARYDAPRLEVPKVSKSDRVASALRKHDDILDAMTNRLLVSGEFFDVSEEQMRVYQERMQSEALSRMAAQQNIGMSGRAYGSILAAQQNVGTGSTKYAPGQAVDSNPWAAVQQSLASLGSLSQHPFLHV